MRNSLAIILFILLSACTSPYAARGIPEIPGIDAEMVGDDEAQLSFTKDFRTDCDYRRNAVLLKSAYIALSNDYDHFDFVHNEDISRAGYKTISLDSVAPIKVYLCRGTCPLMYSADAISHTLVTKFSHPTWESQPPVRKDEKCWLDYKH